MLYFFHLQILLSSKQPGNCTAPTVIQSNLEMLTDIGTFGMFRQSEQSKLTSLL